METINNLSSGVSKAIWGEGKQPPAEKSGTEPVAGEQGAGTTTEPFDKGNEVGKSGDAANVGHADNTTHTENTEHIGTGAGTTTGLFDKGSEEGKSGDAENTEHIGTGAGTTYKGSEEGKSGDAENTEHIGTGAGTTYKGSEEGKSGDAENTEHIGTGAGTTYKGSEEGKSGDAAKVGHTGNTTNTENTEHIGTGADNADEIPKSEQESHQKPSTTKNPDPGTKGVAGEETLETKTGKDMTPHTDEDREKLMMKGEFPRDPNDHSGEPLKMHSPGGDGEDPADKTERAKTDRTASVAHEGGGEHGKTYGTGEQYVKTSGTVADGGDFDATKPGAGAEANRLLEEKGIHKDKGALTTDAASSTSDVASTDPTKPKTSKMDKIKEKLHIGHKKA